MSKQKLSYFRHIMRKQAQGSIGKMIILGEKEAADKRKTKFEMDSFHQRSHSSESSGAEQAC